MTTDGKPEDGRGGCPIMWVSTTSVFETYIFAAQDAVIDSCEKPPIFPYFHEAAPFRPEHFAHTNLLAEPQP
jgi:hypothetical protein